MENKVFLVSFCNNSNNIDGGKHYVCKLKLNLESQTAVVSDVEIDFPSHLAGNGITGMCLYEGSIVLLLQRNPSTLVFLDKEMVFQKAIELTGLKGVHSILTFQNEIYLSVTRQDRIVKINKAGEIQEVWSNQTQMDQIHLNSICIHQNALYASAFGPKSNTLWSSAESGYVFNVNSGELLIKNIWHPHSTFSYAENLYCCNSSHQQIISQNGKLNFKLPGYSRGLYIDDKLILCGSSQGRMVSHSTGMKISNKADNGLIAGTSGVFVLFKGEDKSCFINLSNRASEVFEILPI